MNCIVYHSCQFLSTLYSISLTNYCYCYDYQRHVSKLLCSSMKYRILFIPSLLQIFIVQFWSRSADIEGTMTLTSARIIHVGQYIIGDAHLRNCGSALGFEGSCVLGRGARFPGTNILYCQTAYSAVFTVCIPFSITVRVPSLARIDPRERGKERANSKTRRKGEQNGTR